MVNHIYEEEAICIQLDDNDDDYNFNDETNYSYFYDLLLDFRKDLDLMCMKIIKYTTKRIVFPHNIGSFMIVITFKI